MTPILACKAEETTVATPTAATQIATATVTTPPPTPTVAATATETPPTAMTTTTAPSDAVPLPRNWAGCPSGSYCLNESKAPAGDAGAPAPFAACASRANEWAGDTRQIARPSRSVSFDPELTRTTRATDPKACCYQWFQPCAGGRPLLDDVGEAVLADVRARSDWRIALSPTADEDGDAAATRWAREAVYEHASIASFACLVLDLLALGAPAALVKDALRAASDEVEHARILFGLASATAGRDVGPSGLAGPPARRAPTLAVLVREAIAEGCIGEATAALALRERACASPDRATRALLEGIADDEERHVELAYATVAWALRTGGAEIARVIEEAVAVALDESGPRGRVARELAAPCLGALLASRELGEGPRRDAVTRPASTTDLGGRYGRAYTRT